MEKSGYVKVVLVVAAAVIFFMPTVLPAPVIDPRLVSDTVRWSRETIGWVNYFAWALISAYVTQAFLVSLISAGPLSTILRDALVLTAAMVMTVSPNFVILMDLFWLMIGGFVDASGIPTVLPLAGVAYLPVLIWGWRRVLRSQVWRGSAEGSSALRRRFVVVASGANITLLTFIGFLLAFSMNPI